MQSIENSNDGKGSICACCQVAALAAPVLAAPVVGTAAGSLHHRPS